MDAHSEQHYIFNYAGSSEPLWHDFVLMVKDSIGRDRFSNAELAQILTEVAKKNSKTF